MNRHVRQDTVCGFQNLRKGKDGLWRCLLCKKQMHDNFEAEMKTLLPPESIKLFSKITEGKHP